MKLSLENNPQAALEVLESSALWRKKSGIAYSKWWDTTKLRGLINELSKESELYVIKRGTQNLCAAVLMVDKEDAQEWPEESKTQETALYLHWLAIDGPSIGKGWIYKIFHLYIEYARSKGISLIRADCDFSEKKLVKIYKKLGFKITATLDEGYRETTFLELRIRHYPSSKIIKLSICGVRGKKL